MQVAVEGVEQLEIYFGAYLPQLFYSLLAPLTLFVVLSFVNIKSALVLLVCVPLIPISIVLVQKIAKKLLSKYWGTYTQMGDSVLENLQGITTLKIYQADEMKSAEMDIEAENFRKITMRVLTMQLNSITVMDLIAFGGAALGVIVSVSEFYKGNLSFAGTFAIIMLSAEFFIPLRLLGSFFHIAMNGMAASEKIFRILEMEEVLKKVNLYDFLESEEGLDTILLEKASNLSGGQCQRLVLARAILHDSPIYIFDEATSNIDAESEEDIMAVIKDMAKEKTILLISHRLANVIESDKIYVLNQGRTVEEGDHQSLLKQKGLYDSLYSKQADLENYARVREEMQYA